MPPQWSKSYLNWLEFVRLQIAQCWLLALSLFTMAAHDETSPLKGGERRISRRVVAIGICGLAGVCMVSWGLSSSTGAGTKGELLALGGRGIEELVPVPDALMLARRMSLAKAWNIDQGGLCQHDRRESSQVSVLSDQAELNLILISGPCLGAVLRRFKPIGRGLFRRFDFLSRAS